MIQIYTDGAYNPVSGQGSWGAVIVEDGQKRVFSDTVTGTTGNRMEITAALEGILRTPPGTEIVIYTDSQYLFGCVTKGWQRKANRDLWQQLDEATGQRKVRWEWISRNKSPLHKEAHALASKRASQEEKPPSETAIEELTHTDVRGHPRMVDITEKPESQREAVAKGVVRMQASTFNLIKRHEIAKGDVITVAQLAGIMAAKQTPSLIPLCHPLLLGDIKVEFKMDEEKNIVEITTVVKSTGKTGVEIEALTATAVAALTIYDMCKAVDRSIQIDNIRLIRKSGGKSGTINLE